MGEILGREDRWVRRELDETDRARLEVEMRRVRADIETISAEAKDFRVWAKPKVDAALLGADSDENGDAAITIVEARALLAEMKHRAKIAGARKGQLKATEQRLIDAIANGYEYRKTEVQIIADPNRLEVAIVERATGIEVDRRPMTGEERQRSLPDTSGAPRALQ